MSASAHIVDVLRSSGAAPGTGVAAVGCCFGRRASCLAHGVIANALELSAPTPSAIAAATDAG